MLILSQEELRKGRGEGDDEMNVGFLLFVLSEKVVGLKESYRSDWEPWRRSMITLSYRVSGNARSRDAFRQQCGEGSEREKE
jgi:hypothetical protein